MRWWLAVFALSLFVFGNAHAQCTGTFSQNVTGASGASLTINAGQRVRIAPGGNQTGAIDSELRTQAGKNNFYRVTARSVGGSNSATRVVESVFSTADLTNTGTQD